MLTVFVHVLRLETVFFLDAFPRDVAQVARGMVHVNLLKMSTAFNVVDCNRSTVN